MRIVLLLLLCIAIANVLAAGGGGSECTDYCSVQCDDPDCDDHNECTIDVSIGVDDDRGGGSPYHYKHPSDSSKGCDHIARPPSTTCTIRPTNATVVQGKCCDGLRLGCSHLESDVEHCGACGNRCRELILGAKVPACCGGVCADLFSSLEHCGMCGMSCPGGQVCMGGRCVADPGAPQPTPMMPGTPTPSFSSSSSSSSSSPTFSTSSSGSTSTSSSSASSGSSASTLFQTLTSFISSPSVAPNATTVFPTSTMPDSLPSAMRTSTFASAPLPMTGFSMQTPFSTSPTAPMPTPMPTPNECPNLETICNGSCVDIWKDAKNCGACGRECENSTLCLIGKCVGEDSCRRPLDCSTGLIILAPLLPIDQFTCNTTLPSTANETDGVCCIPSGSQIECNDDAQCCGESAGCNNATGSCCKNNFAACEANNECCLGKCDPALGFCCKPLGTECGEVAECCGSASVSNNEVKCSGGICCLPNGGAGCATDVDCCNPFVCSSGICTPMPPAPVFTDSSFGPMSSQDGEASSDFFP